MFTSDVKLTRLTIKIDSLANELRANNKKVKRKPPPTLSAKSVMVHSAIKMSELREEILRKVRRAQITKSRRNAAVYLSTDVNVKDRVKRIDIHRKHTNAIDGIYVNMPVIESITGLKKDIKSIRRSLIKDEMTADINKYAEFWREAANIKDNDLKGNMKFLNKVESSSEYLKAKYGEQAYYVMEFLILRIMRDAQQEEDDTHNKIMMKAVELAMLKNKELKYSPESFPHPIMVFHEKLLESWWAGVRTLGQLELFKLFRAQGFMNHQPELEFQAKMLGIDIKKGYVYFDEYAAFFAKSILYAALSNLCHLLINKMKFSMQSLPLKMNGYQRGIYINGVKNYNKLGEDIRDVLKTTQSLLMKEKGYADASE